MFPVITNQYKKLKAPLLGLKRNKGSLSDRKIDHADEASPNMPYSLDTKSNDIHKLELNH